MQKGNSKNMIFSFDQIISYISKYYTLRAGDLIYTGTPSGVGKVEIGDNLSCFINGREMLKVNIK
jgi:2-keto-4-pentenoate hydratase/2-oxohepta-3-ene-1,7-dioic acid hydratase in catechol pathway